MANWNTLKTAIADVINANGNQAITGQLLQNALNNIITNVGENATFAGIATLNTNPGTPDGPVFYLATSSGTYANFNGISIARTACVLSWNNGAWVKHDLGIATQEKFTEIIEDISVNGKVFQGNAWIEAQPYTMYPEYTYAIENIGDNPVIAVNAWSESGSVVNLEGFPSSLAPGEKCYVRPDFKVSDIRFYFNGYSSLLIRADIAIDKSLVDLNTKITYVESPFINPDSAPVSPCVKEVQIYTLDKDVSKLNLGINYIWRNYAEVENYPYFIRISYNDENGNNIIWKDWQSGASYVEPANHIDNIWVEQGNTKIRIVIDWSLIEDGLAWSGNLMVFKQECYIFANSEELNKIKNLSDSPFSNGELMYQRQNLTPLAIKDAKIIIPKDSKIPNIGVLYFWKNVNGSCCIRIQDFSNNLIKDWQINNYVPENAEHDLIEIKTEYWKIYLFVNWNQLESGASWLSYELLFKDRCFYIDDSTKSAIIDDVNGTMQSFIDGILDAKFLANNYIAYSTNIFALAYFWKNYGENKECLIRVKSLSPSSNDNYAMLSFSNVEDVIAEYNIPSSEGNGSFYFKIDWSKVPNGTLWDGTGVFENILSTSEETSNVYDGYTIKDSSKKQIWVSQDGTQDYTSIGDAYAAITDSSYENQYEVVVLPGTYDEYNLIPPAFTHTYGLYPNTVKITSRNWANIGDTLPVFDQRTHPSKLSNLTIESWTGYCIHYDVALNNVSIKNENLHLIKQHYDGAMMSIIGGGSFKYGTRYEWKSCIFECVGAEGDASCHTQANSTGDNTSLIFDACSFVKCSPRIGSVGAFGKSTCEVKNCSFTYGQSGLDSWFSPIRNSDNPTEYLANRMEWSVIGGGNKNFAPTVSNTVETIRILANEPIEISGTAVDYIFGNNYKANNNLSSRIRCSITSMYYIDDTQAGYEGYSEMKDVYQLWKRLGDCSETNKILSITVGGITRTHIFKENYLVSKKAESAILAEMQLSFDNCTIEHYTDSNVGYEFINTTDKMFIEVADDDILAGEFITKDGKRATSETNPLYIAGMVVGDTIKGNCAPVWTSAVYVEGYTESGDIGLNDVGELYWAGKDKPVGFIKNRIFYPYY